jgi:uncharacterized protein YndB with AHSA1/START domain
MSTVTIATPSECEVTMTRVVDAPRRLVWEAWTDPAHVPHWMLGPGDWTMPVCEIDLRPGGTWHFVWQKPNGSRMDMSGIYREVEPPVRLVSTEKWGPEWPETINTLVLSESGGRTTIALTVRYPSRQARDEAMKTGMEDGARASFDRLERYVQTLA